MKKRQKLLFFSEAITLAHMVRPYVLASALNKEEYELHIACDARYLHLFPEFPGAIHPITSISSEQCNTKLARGSPLYNLEILTTYCAEDIRVIKQIKPKLIIGDFRLSLAVSAPLTQTPYATITNVYWSPLAVQQFPVPELPLTRVIGPYCAQFLFDIFRPIAFAHHSLALNRLRRKHGLPSLGRDLRAIYTSADYRLYADIPDLIPTNALPASDRFIGPILWSPQLAPPDQWRQLAAGKPILYVTLGSSGAAQVLPSILEATATLPVSVIAATADRTNIHNPPENAQVSRFLPGEAAAELATLVICNGGSPTTQQALAHGKPILGLPSNLDQFLNMQAIVNAGAGLLLRPQRVSVNTLRQLISRLLEEPRFRENAVRLKAQCEQYRAEARFTDFIHEIVKV